MTMYPCSRSWRLSVHLVKGAAVTANSVLEHSSFLLLEGELDAVASSSLCRWQFKCPCFCCCLFTLDYLDRFFFFFCLRYPVRLRCSCVCIQGTSVSYCRPLGRLQHCIQVNSGEGNSTQEGWLPHGCWKSSELRSLIRAAPLIVLSFFLSVLFLIRLLSSPTGSSSEWSKQWNGTNWWPRGSRGTRWNHRRHKPLVFNQKQVRTILLF